MPSCMAWEELAQCLIAAKGASRERGSESLGGYFHIGDLLHSLHPLRAQEATGGCYQFCS